MTMMMMMMMIMIMIMIMIMMMMMVKGHPVHRRVRPSSAPASQNPVHRRGGYPSSGSSICLSWSPSTSSFPRFWLPWGPTNLSSFGHGLATCLGQPGCLVSSWRVPCEFPQIEGVLCSFGALPVDHGRTNSDLSAETFEILGLALSFYHL